MWLKFIGFVPPKEEYSEQDMLLATNLLAVQILRFRDGRVRGMQKMRNIEGLTKELLQAALIHGGYPDSDDSNSDDDEEGSNAAPPSAAHGKTARRGSKFTEGGSGSGHVRRRSSTDGSGDSGGGGTEEVSFPVRRGSAQGTRRGSRFLVQEDATALPQKRGSVNFSPFVSGDADASADGTQPQRRRSDFETEIAHARPTDAGMELPSRGIDDGTSGGGELERESAIMNPIFASEPSASAAAADPDSDDEEGGIGHPGHGHVGGK